MFITKFTTNQVQNYVVSKMYLRLAPIGQDLKFIYLKFCRNDFNVLMKPNTSFVDNLNPYFCKLSRINTFIHISLNGRRQPQGDPGHWSWHCQYTGTILQICFLVVFCMCYQNMLTSQQFKHICCFVCGGPQKRWKQRGNVRQHWTSSGIHNECNLFYQ